MYAKAEDGNYKLENNNSLTTSNPRWNENMVVMQTQTMVVVG